MAADVLTQAEMDRLENCSSKEEWNEICLAVKKARGGAYPSNWYNMVLTPGGYLEKVGERTGMETSMTYTTIDTPQEGEPVVPRSKQLN